MNDDDKLAHRLSLLEGVKFSSADLEAIAKEILDNQRVAAELEEFAKGTAWISHQAQPARKKD
jgi:aldehyde:ferredoxin oxidoreductase